MAHLINDKLNKAAGKTTFLCNDTCKYWTFPHLDKACVLSDVFSVAKGMPCYEYTAKENGLE